MKKLLLLGILTFSVSGCATCGGSDTAAKSGATEGVAVACSKPCISMNCPPPAGTYKLCCPVAPYNQTCP